MSDLPAPAMTVMPPSDAPSRDPSLGLPSVLLLLVVSAAVLVPGIAGVSLFDRDEGWYAQVSREMVESGDWLIPHLYGEVWLAKPPLTYWLVAASYKIFGVGEWQTRLVPVLATILNVLLVAKLGAMLVGRRVGVLAGICFVTSAIMATVCKLLLTDWVMLTCTLAAACLHWRIAVRSGQGSGFRAREAEGARGGGGEGARGGEGDEGISEFGVQISDAVCPSSADADDKFEGPRTKDQASSRKTNAPTVSGPQPLTHDPRSTIHDPTTQSAIHYLSAAYWFCIGLGILAKGPAIILFCGAFGLALLLMPGRRGWLTDRRWWMWMPLAIGVAAPWFVYVHFQAGSVLAGQFIGYEIVARVTNPPKALHPAPPGYHLLLSFAFWLPWTIFVPSALFQGIRAWRSEPAVRVLLAWTLLPWLILELIPSKLLWYVLPCYAPAAILLARYLEPCLRAGTSWPSLARITQREFRLWPLIMILVGAAGAAGAAWAWDRRWSPQAVCTSAILIIGFAIVLALRYRQYTTRSAFIVGLLTTVAFHATFWLWLLPRFEPMRLSRQVGEALAAQARAGDCICICGHTEPTAHFYLRGHSAAELKPEELVQALAVDSGPILLAVTEGTRNRLEVSAWIGWHREVLGRLEGRNYARGFAPETVILERLTRAGRVATAQSPLPQTEAPEH